MHIEFLTEDSSSRRLLEHVVPKLIGPPGQPHTWRMHPYRRIGRIPARLTPTADPSRRLVLDRLPSILRGYAKTPGIDLVAVVLDADDRDRAAFLAELRQIANASGAGERVMFRLAIEETEAWYLGDRNALAKAYPRARLPALDASIQDSVCGTRELLTDVIHPGGDQALRQPGAPLPGQIKHEWADRIGPLLDPEARLSPSFGKLRDGLRRLAGIPSAGYSGPAFQA